MTNAYPLTSFSEEDQRATRPEMKIGLLATQTPDGLPHITLLSSLMACGEKELCFGQFTEGDSKKHILLNPRVGFLIMGLDRTLWRGQAIYTRYAKEGPEYDHYNNVPMFRYNAYFGVHTVYYFDLVAHTGRQPLPMGKIIPAALTTMLARTLGGKDRRATVLNPWTRAFFNKIDNLKFLSWIGADGFPRLVPAIQAQSLDARRLIFSPAVYADELAEIPSGAPLAVFGMALTMEDVLVRGVYRGVRRCGGVRVGLLEADWVYNPMPPVPGQIYPPLDLRPVSEF